MLDNYPDVMTVDEARDVLKMSRNAMYRAIKLGIIPAMRVGPRLIRISKETIKELINGTRNTNTEVKG